MATKKISQLEAITEAENSDVLVIVDVSEGTTNKITKNNLLKGTGHTIEMSLNENYQIVLKLKNAEGTELSTATIDLPNENAITNISYNNGVLTLTKQSGATSQVDISSLINGLATETALNSLANALKQTIGIQTNTYNESQTYNTGDTVVQNEKIYKANQDNITGTFDSSKWDEISLYEYQKIQDEAIKENYKVITKLQEDVEDLTERVEDAENNQLTNTPEIATSHYLQDSADSRFRKFIPIGRTTQESTTGKQLFDKDTVTANEYITDSGTVGNSNNLCMSTKIPVNTGETYTISGLIQGVSGYQWNVSYWNGDTYLSRELKGVLSYTFTTPVNCNGVILSLWKTDLSKVQLEQGSTATDYEPYTGGEPAPNPNYPYAIKNTGDNVNEFDGEFELGQLNINTGLPSPSDSRIRTKNFQEIEPNTTYTISGISAIRYGCYYDENQEYIDKVIITSTASTEATITTPNNAKYIKWHLVDCTDITTKEKLEQGTKATPYSSYGCGNVNEKVQNENLFDLSKSSNGFINFNTGAFVADNTYTSSDFIMVEEVEQYYSNFTTFSSSTYGLAFYDKDKNYISGRQLINLITVPDNAKYIRFCVRNSNYSGSYITDINTLYFVKGDSPTSYVPHSEQNISFPLAQGQKFYEGSHPDDDEKVHHKRKQFTLDGSQLMSKFIYNSNLSTTNYSCFLYNDNEIKQATNDTEVFVLADKLKGTPSNQRTSDMANCWINHLSTGQLGMHVPNTITNTTELKTWLTENPITFEVPLAEETTEDFTSEQQTAWEQIKKARTYKNITHISSEDETPANVEIEYVVDINTIDDRITALEAKVDLLEE